MNTVVGYVLMVLLLFGVNTVIWALVGILRWSSNLLRRTPRGYRPEAGDDHVPGIADVAILMAAHNEAAVIEASIASAAKLVPPQRIFVVSDGSSDATVELARSSGAQVLDLQPNRGKAGALATGVREFALPDRFEIVMILDADTEPHVDYLRTGLPLFSDPGVAVVAGRATTQWNAPGIGLVGRALLAHRERIYTVLQWLIKYGQGHEAIDVINIAPGFATMYRSSVLREIDMNPPGLVIEDFNMTFEIHRRRLGRIAFHPAAAVAQTQDPARLQEYLRQVHRWSLGYWQTVRLHGLRHKGLFWASVALYSAELVISSVALLITAAVLVVGGALMGLASALSLVLTWPDWMPTLGALALVILIPDLIITCVVAAAQRRFRMFAAAPAFPILRVLDAWLILYSLSGCFRTASTGRWTSPTRRLAAAAPDTSPS